MTLTVDELRGFIETSLGDDELQAMLDAAYEEIDRIAGASGSEDYPASITEYITAGPGPIFMLSRPAESITSIDENDTDLASDDYELIGDQMVRRLSDGTNGASWWRKRMIVTYTPLSMAENRDRVARELVALDVGSSPGVKSERIGEWAVTYGDDVDYAKTRESILASFFPAFIAK